MSKAIEKLNSMLQIEKINVKFIRLGEGGKRFEECFSNNLIFFGFNSNEFLNECNNFQNSVDFIKDQLLSLGYKKIQDTLRQYDSFFSDTGNTLWVTTANRKIYYGFTDASPAFLKDNRTYKRMIDSWSCLDASQEILDISGLNGGITKTLAYQSTICSFNDKYSRLLINRILNKPNHQKTDAYDVYNNLVEKIKNLIEQFEPKDFELLIELIISRLGLKRVGVAGKQEEFIDIEVQNPLTEEKYVVQVKSKTSNAQLAEYIEKYLAYRNDNEECKMIYAYHSGDICVPNNYEGNIILWDGNKISRLAVNNGLADWVIQIAPV